MTVTMNDAEHQNKAQLDVEGVGSHWKQHEAEKPLQV
jgi:hypothetical protein